jgi:hypothetical protein
MQRQFLLGCLVSLSSPYMCSIGRGQRSERPVNLRPFSQRTGRPKESGDSARRTIFRHEWLTTQWKKPRGGSDNIDRHLCHLLGPKIRKYPHRGASYDMYSRCLRFTVCLVEVDRLIYEGSIERRLSCSFSANHRLRHLYTDPQMSMSWSSV